MSEVEPRNGRLEALLREAQEENKLIKIRLERTVDAAYHALLEMSAWMGLPESKRQHQIEEHMSNVKFCAENNVPGDEVKDVE